MQMSTKIIIAPMKYVQGPGELGNLAKYTKVLGKKVLLIMSPSNLKNNRDQVVSSLEKEGLPYEIAEFNRECSKAEVERLGKLVKDCEVVVGIGGGKVIDAAKYVAYVAKLPVVIAPTIASTDAPCSALSVFYTEDGVFEEFVLLSANPNAVVVDTEIVAKAPSRMLVSGMGDALATYFEARACNRAGKTTVAGGYASISAQTLARLSYDILLADGLKAKLAVDAGSSSHAVENIIEANTFLSGIGFESGGLGAAHSIHNGLTVLKETHHCYHGEKVSFGVVTQLVLENAPLEEINTVVNFCKSVGLPTNFADLGITEVTPEKIKAVAKQACVPGEIIHNMPFEITEELVYSAMIVADKLGA
jgi:glycerol dehydrogenase